jgi:hypothetical protein
MGFFGICPEILGCGFFSQTLKTAKKNRIMALTMPLIVLLSCDYGHLEDLEIYRDSQFQDF